MGGSSSGTKRHEITPSGEISGHFHPTATVRLRAGRPAGRCFVSDDGRLVLPAFGAFTGGPDIFDPAIAGALPVDSGSILSDGTAWWRWRRRGSSCLAISASATGSARNPSRAGARQDPARALRRD
jgi:hypothetical protein